LKAHSAHAGYAPWEGVNALDAAFVAYAGISALRQQIRPEQRVHGVISGRDWTPNGSLFFFFLFQKFPCSLSVFFHYTPFPTGEKNKKKRGEVNESNNNNEKKSSGRTSDKRY
jgi:hypothetical protein